MAQQSPADRQAQAKADVERIAEAFYTAGNEALFEEIGANSRRWNALTETERRFYRRTVEKLLTRGVIRVGERPVVEAPMAGQTTIEEQLDG